jgi:hypothetical protein
MTLILSPAILVAAVFLMPVPAAVETAAPPSLALMLKTTEPVGLINTSPAALPAIKLYSSPASTAGRVKVWVAEVLVANVTVPDSAAV